MIMIMIGFLNG